MRGRRRGCGCREPGRGCGCGWCRRRLVIKVFILLCCLKIQILPCPASASIQADYGSAQTTQSIRLGETITKCSISASIYTQRLHLHGPTSSSASSAQYLSSARKASIATSCPRSARPLVDNPSFRSFPPLSSQQFLVAEYGHPRAFGGTCDEKKNGVVDSKASKP